MKRLLAITLLPFVFLFFSLFAMVQSVFAHTLKIDGSIGVTLHIDPDDEPVAGKESKLFVDISDKSGRFNPNNPGTCDCLLTIKEKNTILKTLPIVAGGSYTQLRYIFPEPGTYLIVIEGKSNKNGIPFQAFTTRYEYYVRPNNQVAPLSRKNPLLMYAPYMALIMGLVIICMFTIDLSPILSITKKRER